MLLKPFDTSAFHTQLACLAVEIEVSARTQIVSAEVSIEHEQFFNYLTALGEFDRFYKMASSPVFDGIKYAENVRNMVFPEYPDYVPETDIPF